MKLESVKIGASGVASIAAGGSSFLVDLGLLAELGLDQALLVPGAELEEEATELLVLADQVIDAEKRGASLLARAEQSAWMLRLKLEARGLPSRAVKLAITRLEASGLLDDERFSRAYVAARLSAKAEGPTSLVGALRAKGIDGDLAKAAVSAAIGANAAPDERKAALEKAAARELKRAKGDERMARSRLRGLGFKGPEIASFFGDED